MRLNKRFFYYFMLVIILTTPVLGAEKSAKDESVLLQWKLVPGQTFVYQTALQAMNLDQSDFSEFDFNELTDGVIPPEIEKKLGTIKIPSAYNMISILEGLPDERLNVKMALMDSSGFKSEDTNSDLQKDLTEAIKKFSGKVQLRAEIDCDGDVKSFYLKEGSRNVVLLFFALPKTPVNVGDRWSIDGIHLVTTEANFICEKASRINQVQLTGLTPKGETETVATLDYIISESITGDAPNPMTGEMKPLSIAMSFIGRGEFLVEKGGWQRFYGEMRIKATGLLKSDVVQQFALVPIEKVPEGLTEVE